MALRRRVPGGGAPSDSDPLTGESQLPGVRDTRVGLGGEDQDPLGLGEPPPARDKGKVDPGLTNLPQGLDPHGGQSGETPRERPQFTPPTPHAPDPMTGQPGGGMTPPPMQPFPPMQGNPVEALITPGGGPMSAGAGPQRRSLFGSMGGLKGGGLGVPLDPTSNQSSDSIQSLIQSLMRRKPTGGFGSF